MQTPRTLTIIRNHTTTWMGALPAGRGRVPPGIPPLDLRQPVTLEGPPEVTWWIPQLALLPIDDLLTLCEEPDVARRPTFAVEDEGYETGAWPHVDPDRWTFNGSPLRVVQADRARLVPWSGEVSVLAEAGACTPVSMTSGYDFVRVRAVSEQLLLVHRCAAEEHELTLLDTALPDAQVATAAEIVLDGWYPSEIGFVPAWTEMNLDLPADHVERAVAWVRANAAEPDTNRLTVNGADIDLTEVAR